jgi:hypothetical protein
MALSRPAHQRVTPTVSRDPISDELKGKVLFYKMLLRD